ncbi:MAG: hypothetical protein AVDCRST_MAG27-445, partial [uncultured Craurococcus sp.]
ASDRRRAIRQTAEGAVHERSSDRLPRRRRGARPPRHRRHPRPCPDPTARGRPRRRRPRLPHHLPPRSGPDRPPLPRRGRGARRRRPRRPPARPAPVSRGPRHLRPGHHGARAM